jgi:hypothetical protein
VENLYRDDFITPTQCSTRASGHDSGSSLIIVASHPAGLLLSRTSPFSHPNPIGATRLSSSV